MPGRQRDLRWRLPTAGSLTSALLLALACSGPDATDFFSSPPLGGHGGKGGSAGAASGSGGAGGSGGSGDAAGVGNDGGAPDATGGTGNATGGSGEPSTGGTSDTGGSTSTGGSGADAGTGGSSATGGTGGDSSTGGTTGGMSGFAGDGTGGTGLAGGMGGLAPIAGMAGVGGSDPGTGGGAGKAGMGGKGGGCTPTEPEDETCDGVDNDCKGGIDDGNTCPDGCVGGVLGKHTYLLCHGDETYTRQEARAECNAHGEDMGLTLELVRVESEAESDFLMELIPQIDDSHAIWMGASDSTMGGSTGEGSWVWGPAENALLFYEDDEVVDDLFANWGEGEPDDGGFDSSEDCAAFEPELDYRWDDRVCSDETEMYLCEQLDD